MASTSIKIQGGMAVVVGTPSGVEVRVHTGAAAFTLRMDLKAAAQFGDAVSHRIVEQTQAIGSIADAVEQAIKTRTFREQLSEVPR